MKDALKRLLAICLAFALLAAATALPVRSAYADPEDETTEQTQMSSAELQEKLDAANAYLSEINIELMDAGEALNETRYNLSVTNQAIEETTASIEQKQGELAQARVTLSSRTRADYKAGPTTFLSVLLESRSFAELISHIYYVDKINEADHAAIVAVETLKAELEIQQTQLEAAKAEQVQLEAEQEERQAALEAKVAEQAAYVSSLDSQVQEALAREEEERRRAEEEAAAAARAAAEEAARIAAEQAQNNPAPQENTDDGSSESSSGGDSSSDNSGGGSSTPAPTVDTSTGGLTAEQRNIIIAAAYSTLGTPYVYGGESPGSGIDCSGMTQYAYAQAGIYLPHYSQAQMGMCQPLQSISSLQPGDLVFWTYPRHVAIYLGDGMVIEAVQPGVKIQAIWGSPVGGGCPV